MADNSSEKPKSVMDLSALSDLPVTVEVVIGRVKITIGKLMSMSRGSVIELDRAAGEPLDILVNGALVGRGEVVVVNERYAVRVTEVVSQQENLAAPKAR